MNSDFSAEYCIFFIVPISFKIQNSKFKISSLHLHHFIFYQCKNLITLLRPDLMQSCKAAKRRKYSMIFRKIKTRKTQALLCYATKVNPGMNMAGESK